MLLRKSRGQLLIAPERMKLLGQSRNDTELWMSACENKDGYCKKQYCLETWNIRYINQGKLDVVMQEMARLNIDILGISELT